MTDGPQWGTPNPPPHVALTGALPMFCVKMIDIDGGAGGYYFCNRRVDDPCHIPTCEFCGDSGLLNAEVIEAAELGGAESVWKNEVTWCHGCPRGLEWKELLNG